MKNAHNRMKQQVDKHKSDRTFEIGDMMYVKLHPYRQTYVAFQKNAKLALKYFGPFQIDDKMGTMAYKLQFLFHSKIHNVFHVLQLKRYVEEVGTSISIPVDGLNIKEPKLILN